MGRIFEVTLELPLHVFGADGALLLDTTIKIPLAINVPDQKPPVVNVHVPPPEGGHPVPKDRKTRGARRAWGDHADRGGGSGMSLVVPVSAPGREAGRRRGSRVPSPRLNINNSTEGNGGGAMA